MVTKKSEIMCEVIEKRQKRAFLGDESLKVLGGGYMNIHKIKVYWTKHLRSLYFIVGKLWLSYYLAWFYKY